MQEPVVLAREGRERSWWPVRVRGRRPAGAERSIVRTLAGAAGDDPEGDGVRCVRHPCGPEGATTGLPTWRHVRRVFERVDEHFDRNLNAGSIGAIPELLLEHGLARQEIEATPGRRAARGYISGESTP